MADSNGGKSRSDAVRKRAKRPARGCLFFLTVLILMAAGAGAALWYFKPALFGKVRGEVEKKMGDATSALPIPRLGDQSAPVTVYFADSKWTKLVAVKKPMASQADPELRVRKIIEMLTRDGGAGTQAPLPSGAKLKNAYFSNDGTVTLDFAPTLGELSSWGAEGELIAVYSIVNSVAGNVEAAKKVRIIIDGKPAETLAGHVLIDIPLSPRNDLF